MKLPKIHLVLCFDRWVFLNVAYSLAFWFVISNSEHSLYICYSYAMKTTALVDCLYANFSVNSKPNVLHTTNIRCMAFCVRGFTQLWQCSCFIPLHSFVVEVSKMSKLSAFPMTQLSVSLWPGDSLGGKKCVLYPNSLIYDFSSVINNRLLSY